MDVDYIDVCGLVLPNKPLNSYELLDAVKKLKIKNFRGVFCSDELPKIPNKIECGILNLDDSTNGGTHWTAYIKNGNVCIYFDSYGLAPPSELRDYLGQILYNTEQVQFGPTVFCGHLCLYVLKRMQDFGERAEQPSTFQKIINDLY